MKTEDYATSCSSYYLGKKKAENRYIFNSDTYLSLPMLQCFSAAFG
jgi:CTP:phosphocholine cytidylyltransferase-like protein